MEEEKKNRPIPKIIREEYDGDIWNMPMDKIDFYIKLEKNNLKQLEMYEKCVKQAQERKKKQIETLLDVKRKRCSNYQEEKA